MGFLENLFQNTLPGECIGKKAAPKPAPVTPPAPEPAKPEPAPGQPAAEPQAVPQTPPVQPQAPVQPASAPRQTSAQPQPQSQKPQSQPQSQKPQPQAAPGAGASVEMEHLLSTLIIPANFPAYSIYQDVHPGTLDTTAHPKSRRISYLFRLNGAPKLAVFLMDRSQEGSMPTVGTCRILDSRGIPYIFFFRRDRSDPQTVLQTIRGKLGRR